MVNPQVFGLILLAVGVSVLLGSAWPLVAAGGLMIVLPEVFEARRRRVRS